MAGQTAVATRPCITALTSAVDRLTSYLLKPSVTDLDKVIPDEV